MTNCVVSLISASPSPSTGGGPFFSWLFSCRGIATSSWCTFTASPLRCCSHTHTHTHTHTHRHNTHTHTQHTHTHTHTHITHTHTHTHTHTEHTHTQNTHTHI